MDAKGQTRGGSNKKVDLRAIARHVAIPGHGSKSPLSKPNERAQVGDLEARKAGCLYHKGFLVNGCFVMLVQVVGHDPQTDVHYSFYSMGIAYAAPTQKRAELLQFHDTAAVERKCIRTVVVGVLWPWRFCGFPRRFTEGL